MEPWCTLGYYFNSRVPPKMSVMWKAAGRVSLLLGGVMLLSAALTALVLWILPRPYRPLEYVISGAVGTVIWLGGALVLLRRNGRISVFRIVRRSGRSS
jgi:hypothetical protein